MAALYRSIICLLTAFILFWPTLSRAILSEDEVFTFDAQIIANNLQLYWRIAPDNYLYKDQLKVLNPQNVNILKDVQLPPAQLVEDSTLGNYYVYADQLLINIPWQQNLAQSKLLVTYQGCNRAGFCYLPTTKLLQVNADYSVTIIDSLDSVFLDTSPIDKIVRDILNNNLLITLLLFFGFGLLLSFTPCVLPMIPLVINLIVGTKKISMHRAFVLASIYVIGMAGSYAVAGVFAGMLGATLQVWMQHPAILIGFSILLIVLAFAQLDVIKLRMPNFNINLHRWSEGQLQGSKIGALLLGIISALIVSPCITPPLIGALTYISQDGSPLIGGLALFSLGLGMGAPLILVAVVSSKILPKAGRWMIFAKYITGFALLGLALWLLLRIAPLPEKNLLPWKYVNTIQELEANVKGQQYSLVDFYATWCVSCRKIDTTVFADPNIAALLEDVNLLRVDLSTLNADKRQILKSLNIYGPPAILFYTPEGKEIKSKRLSGEVDVEQVQKRLDGL